MNGKPQKKMLCMLQNRNGAIINESAIKATSNYSEYKESQEKALPKIKYYSKMMTELRKVLEEEIKPLNHN